MLKTNLREILGSTTMSREYLKLGKEYGLYWVFHSKQGYKLFYPCNKKNLNLSFIEAVDQFCEAKNRIRKVKKEMQG